MTDLLYKDVKPRYDIDPLKEIYYKLKEKNDMYFALALRKNITEEFFQFLKRQLDKNELININISGRPRSGKSTDAIIITMWIYQYCNYVKKHNRKFAVEYNILFSSSELLSKFDKESFNFHDCFITDEKRKYETIQSGSLYEEGQLTDIDRIGAKFCIHRINIIGSYDDIDNEAYYHLVTYGKNYQDFTSKLIVFTRENNERVPIGYIEIPVKNFLCDDVINNIVISCSTCPKYSQENFNKFNKKKIKFISCELEKAKYERMKDKNIDVIFKGGKLEERTKIKIDLSKVFMKLDEYNKLPKKQERIIYIKDNYFRYTNRRLTIDELEEIVNRTEMLRTITKNKKSNLQNFIK